MRPESDSGAATEMVMLWSSSCRDALQMKRCGKCGRSYADESLNFCLEDGTVLSHSLDPQATLLNTSPRPTNPQTTEVLPRLPIQPKPSQAWSLYLIIGLVVLVVGTVVISLIILAATNSTTSSGSTDDSTTASPTYSSEPLSTPTIDLSGTWRDVFGGTSQITQTGETFQMTSSGTACRGRYVSSATGTISGTRIDLMYQSTYSRGQCSGSVSSDGVRVTLTCTDSACGQFESMSERVGN